MPRVGTRVTIRFLDARISGSIERVSEDHHHVDVLTDDGEIVTFELNRATARWIAVGAHAGARLLFGAR